MMGQDGELHVELRIEGDNYAVFTDDFDADMTLGDPGTAGFDASGNWVTTSNSQGCPGCSATYQWSVEGSQLVLTLLDARNFIGPMDVLIGRLVTEGTYTRQ